MEKKEIKKYLKRLKQEAKWNKDILESIGEKCRTNPYIKALLDLYLRTTEVNEDDYDFANANVFEDVCYYNTDETYVGIQARNIGECGMSYFYIHPERSEAEYKNNKLNAISKELSERYAENSKKIDELNGKNDLLREVNKCLLGNANASIFNEQNDCEMKNINKATKNEIADYLEHLYEIATEKACGDENSVVWSRLYDTVFSDSISKVIYNRFPDFDPFDPDASYKEDVCVFIHWFRMYVDGEVIAGGVCKTKDVSFPTFEEWNDENEL